MTENSAMYLVEANFQMNSVMIYCVKVHKAIRFSKLIFLNVLAK